MFIHTEAGTILNLSQCNGVHITDVDSLASMLTGLSDVSSLDTEAVRIAAKQIGLELSGLDDDATPDECIAWFFEAIIQKASGYRGHIGRYLVAADYGDDKLHIISGHLTREAAQDSVNRLFKRLEES